MRHQPPFSNAAPLQCTTSLDCSGAQVCDPYTSSCGSSFPSPTPNGYSPMLVCMTDFDCPGADVCVASVCSANSAMCQDDFDCAGELFCDYE